jgi:hypothetical protein
MRRSAQIPHCHRVSRKDQESGLIFEASVADCGYEESNELEMALRDLGLPYVLVRGNIGTGDGRLRTLPSHSRKRRKSAETNWQVGKRRFRDGRGDIWWAAVLPLAGYGPGKKSAVYATTDLDILLKISTRHLSTNLTRTGFLFENSAPLWTAQLG